MVIAFLNQKGGVGKSTLAIHVATALALSDYRMLLVDADPQGSAYDWSTARQGEPLFPVIKLPTKDLPNQIQRHIPNYDHIVIDGAPRVNELARAAIIAADMVVIPVQPSPYDVWAAKEIVDMLGEAATFQGNRKATFVVNRKIANTAIGRDVVQALSSLNIPILSATVSQRVAFAETAIYGSTVLQSAPNSAAAREIGAIVDELAGML